MTVTTDTRPRPERSVIVVQAPGDGPGNWAGAPSAVLVDGVYWLAYRVRQPLDRGRGVAGGGARAGDGGGVRAGTGGRREEVGGGGPGRPPPGDPRAAGG